MNLVELLLHVADLISFQDPVALVLLLFAVITCLSDQLLECVMVRLDRLIVLEEHLKPVIVVQEKVKSFPVLLLYVDLDLVR